MRPVYSGGGGGIVGEGAKGFHCFVKECWN